MKKSFYMLLLAMACYSPLLAQTNTWTKMADLNSTRIGGVAFNIAGKGYMGTGSANSSMYSNDFWQYDPYADTWTQMASFPGATRLDASGFVIGGKGYLGTGYSSSGYVADFYEYDPAANAWTQKASLPSARTGAAGFAIGSKGYLGTGANNLDLDDFYEYDPATDVWTAKATVPGGLRHFATSFAIGTKGYLGTGATYNSYYSDFYEYDPSSNTWTQKTAFPGGTRFHASAFVLGSKGYFGTGSGSSDFWAYDPATNLWTQKASFGGGIRVNANAFAIDNTGYICGGYNGSSTNQKDVWKYVISDFKAGSISGSPFCGADLVSIPYTSTITFGVGNVFTAQLSEGLFGSFATPFNIGTLASTASSGTISGVIPFTIQALANQYRIRILSSNPAAVSLDNGTSFQVYPSGIPSITINGSATLACTIPNVTYQWNRNGVAIPGATDSLYTYTSTGAFTVTIVTRDGCHSTSGPYTSLAVPSQLLSSLSAVFPNPAHRQLTLKLQNGDLHNNDQIVVKMYDINGRMIAVLCDMPFGQFNGHLVLPELPTGLYNLLLMVNGFAAGNKSLMVE